MDQIQRAQNELKGYRHQVAIKDAVQRLMANKDFQSVIMQYYIVDECARYAHVSGDYNAPKESRESALACAQAAGHLKRFLGTTIQLGELAERSAKETEQAIEEMQGESN